MTEHGSVVGWGLGRGSAGAVGIDYTGTGGRAWWIVTYFDCGDSFTHLKTYQIVYFKFVQCIVCQLYLQKTLNSMRKLIGTHFTCEHGYKNPKQKSNTWHPWRYKEDNASWPNWFYFKCTRFV